MFCIIIIIIIIIKRYNTIRSINAVYCILICKRKYTVIKLQGKLRDLIRYEQSPLEDYLRVWFQESIPKQQKQEVFMGFWTRGLSGYRARRRVADSRGPAFVACLSLYKETVDQLPNPRVLCVACLNPCWRDEWHMGDMSLTEPLGNLETSQSM